MPYRPFTGQQCSVAAALAVVGERWTLLILREILLGRTRFEELRRETGVATNILTDRLQTLVDHGLLRREAGGEHVEYRPTRKGADVEPILGALMRWGDAYAAPDGPPRVVVHTVCGHDAHPRPHCSHCGELVTPDTVVARPGPGATAAMRAEGPLPAGRLAP